MSVADPELFAATWNLEPLVDGRGDDGPDLLLDDAAARTARFAQAYGGRVAAFDAAALVQAMGELAVIRDLILRASVYAQLRFVTDSSDPVRGALAQHVQERVTELDTELVFFELEWSALDAAEAERLLDMAGAQLDFAAQYLRARQRRRPHLLSGPEERLMAARRLTGEQAWARLYEELLGGLSVELEGERVPYSLAHNQLSDPNSARRRAAVDGLVAGIPSGLSTRTYIFNTLLHDKAVEDRLRGYPTWLSSRNIENELADASVQALIDAVVSRYDIARRWCRLKAGLLGGERLAHSDLRAPVLVDETRYSYGAARELVVAAYHDFSPEFAVIARRCFDEHWIDAPIRPNKMVGAVCETGGPNRHPYVLLNHGGTLVDVFTIAHELGHGIHDVLAAGAGVFHQQSTIAVGETASTFAELLLLEHMLGRAGSPRERLGLLASAADESLVNVFREVAYNRFEERAHGARRSDGELSTERLNSLYQAAIGELYGDAVELHPGLAALWSTLPHFFLWPGYVYTYAYGQLLSYALFARYRELGAEFVPDYRRFLAAGSSRSPEVLGSIVGVDLSDPGFWDSALELIDQRLDMVEQLMAQGAHQQPA